MELHNKNKTVLITGASTGIGKATAYYFHSKGRNVVATMRSPEKEQELKEDNSLKILKLDVEDKKSISEAVKKTLEIFGTLDVLVNNA